MNDGRAGRVELAGDLDVYRRDEIAALFPSPESVDELVVDMRNATVVDSSIIAVFMRYRRAFIDAGHDAHAIVVVVPPRLRRVFEITGLVTLLTVVTAPPDASRDVQLDESPNESPDKPLTEA